MKLINSNFSYFIQKPLNKFNKAIIKKSPQITHSKFKNSSFPIILPKNFKNITKKLNLSFADENLKITENYKKFETKLKELKPEEKLLRKQFNGLENIYTIENAIHSNKGYTDGIIDCLAVLIHSDKDAYLAHISPDNYKQTADIEHLKNYIQSYINKLEEKSNTKCRAWIVGGQENQSQKLYENVSDVLKKNNIIPSEILYPKISGQETSLYYNLNEGKILLNKNLIFDSEDLKETFKKINI